MGRKRRPGRADVGRKRKECPVCSHLERSVVERALVLGQSPRSIVRRYVGITRLEIQRHKDECIRAKRGEGA